MLQLLLISFLYFFEWVFHTGFTVSYPGNFELNVEAGQFSDSEIVVMLGENGTGKTTFVRMLAGKLTPDEGGIQFFYSFTVLFEINKLI